MRDAITRLQKVLPGQVVVDPDLTAAYGRDQCVLTPAGLAAAVVHAESVDDVTTTLKIAHQHGIPVVTRGTGTGLAGAANAIDGCVILSMARMNQILDIDSIARTATVQPGVINGDLDRAARDRGLFYAPDPGSRSISSIGGNLATNAGGMCCPKYGATADHALTLTVVLADGEIIHTGRTTRKDATGLNLTRLLVGSEGTLGVIVEATVRLLPLPTGLATVAATFPTVADAVATVLAIGNTASPSAVELMDRTTVSAINAMTHMGLDETAGAVMLLQCDGPHAAQEIIACAELAKENGALEVLHTDDVDEGVALMEARRIALTALERLGTILLDDVCVPVHLLPELQMRIEQASASHNVLIGSFGHAADGNLHPTIIFDASSADATRRAHAAFEEIVDATIALGGSVSGEHGIGLLKASYVERQVGVAERQLMHRIKDAFDPTGILNPGRGY